MNVTLSLQAGNKFLRIWLSCFWLDRILCLHYFYCRLHYCDQSCNRAWLCTESDGLPEELAVFSKEDGDGKRNRAWLGNECGISQCWQAEWLFGEWRGLAHAWFCGAFWPSVGLSHPPLFLNWPGLAVVVPLDCHRAVGEPCCAVWCLWLLLMSWGVLDPVWLRAGGEAAAFPAKEPWDTPVLPGWQGRDCWSWQSELAQSWGTCGVFQAVCVSFVHTVAFMHQTWSLPGWLERLLLLGSRELWDGLDDWRCWGWQALNCQWSLQEKALSSSQMRKQMSCCSWTRSDKGQQVMAQQSPSS